MTRVRVFFGFAFILICGALFNAPVNAATVTTELRILLDVDNNAATGCVVSGMGGTDQVLVTRVVTDDADGTAHVTRTHRLVCSSGVLGAPVDVIETGWPAGFQAASGDLLVETRIPFSAVGGSSMPHDIRVGVEAVQGVAVHTALTRPDGSVVLFPTVARGKRRSVGTPGADRVITLDGIGSDWYAIPPMFNGIASGGTQGLRMVRFFGFANDADDFLYFRFDANLSNDAPFAEDDEYSRAAGTPLTVPAPGVLGNDGDPNGLPLTATPIAPAAHGTVTLNPDGSFTYTPNTPDPNQDDAFEYKASNGTKLSNAARVRINVDAVAGNQPPILTFGPAVTVAEGTSVVGSVTATDPDGDAVTFTISGGADQARFTLSGTTLSFSAAPDFEAPLDADGNGVYVVELTADDGNGGTDVESISVTVTNVDETPVFVTGNAFSVDENTTAVGTVSASDPDGTAVAYAITGGADAAQFTINGSTGALSFSTAPDFENAADSGANNSYVLQVTASDGANSADQTITVTVGNVDEAPSFVSANTPAVPENTTAVITVVADDPEGSALTYSISGGADAALFGIDAATGALSFLAARNFEAPADSGADNVYNVTVQATDGTNAVTQAIAVTVTNVNEAPVITSANTASVSENATAVVTVTSTDEDGTTATYAVTGGADQALFTIDAATGALTFTAAPNFEAPADSDTDNVYLVQVTATDGTNSVDQLVTVTVTNVNEAPSFTSAALTNATEDTAYTYNITAADPDAGATLTIAASTLPAWLSFTDNGNGTATLTGTPANAEVGSHAVVLDLSDGTHAAQQSFSIAVANTNDAPAFTSVAVTDATEDSAYTYNVTTSDVDAGDTRTITASTKPAWLTITDNGDGTATLSGTPANGDVGANNVVLDVNDGEATVQQSFTITVANVNDAPSFTSAAVTTATEDSAYTYNVTTADVDAGDTRTISAAVKPAWLTIADNGDGTATLSGTPANAEVGTHNVTLEVNDGEVAVQQSFTITVINTNDAPTFTSAGITTATEDVAYTYNITTDDVDAGDTRTITAPAKPAWLTITDNGNGTATLSGTPSNSDVGTHNVTIEVNDGDVAVQQSFTVTVANVNDAPTFTSAAVTNATEDVAYVYNVTTGDVDAGDTRTITAPTKPDWLSFTDNGDGTATLTGTPSNAEVGTHNVVLEVNDGDVTVQQSFTITVANANDAPTFTSAAVTTATEDVAYTYNVTTDDVDAGDTRTIAAPSKPAWLTLTDNGDGTATLAGTPSNSDVGTHNVTLEVNDGEATVQQSFTITVANVNDAPAFDSAAVTAATEDVTYTYNVVTSDVDAGDTRTIAATTKPAWLTLTDNGDGTATLTGTPSNAEVGSHNVVLEVNDGDVTVQQSFTITVGNANDAPTFTSAAVTTATEDVAYTYNVTTADVDAGDTRTITAPTKPAWLTITDNNDGTATLAGTPSNSDVGTHNVTLEVNDGEATVQQSFTITVANVNDAPAFSSAAVTTATEDVAYAYNITTDDVDAGDTRTITAPTKPAWLSFTDNGDGTATLTGTPTNAEVGSHNVVLEVNDGDVTVQQSFTIAVGNANDAPTFTSAGVTTATEDVAYTYNVTTDDADTGDTRTITAPTKPAWLTLTDNGDGTATLSGTPLNGDVGANSVTLEVNDGEAAVQQSFTITVANVNDAPAFDSAAVTAATEDVTYTYNVVTSDVDAGDTRTIAAPTKPAWLSFTDNGDGTATLTGTPANAEVGSHNVVLEVNDGDVTVQQSFTITVANANDAPAFTSAALTAATEDAAYTYNIITSDDDAGDTRTITAPTKPAWLTLTDNGDGTATLAGTPLNGDVGANSVTLEVDDGEATVQQSFTITVANTNDAPTFTSTAVTTASEDVAYTYNIATADVDAGDTRSITAPTKPAWLTFTDNGDGTATLAGTPTNAEVGTHNVTLEVTDAEATVQQSFTITVSNTNDAPAFTSVPVTTGAEDVAYTYNVTTADADAGDTRTITAPTKPAWLTLTDNGDGTATLSGTPLDAHVGANSVTLEVNDGEATVQQSFTITVSNTNDVPVANADTDTAIEDGGPVTGNVTTNDTDDDIGDTLTVSEVNGSSTNVGASISATYGSVTIGSDGAYTYTIDNSLPAVQALGSSSSIPEVFNYTITDGTASDSSTLTVTVTGANDAPSAAADTNSMTEDTASVSGDVLANDTDVDGGDTKTVTEVGGSTADVGAAVAGTYGSINIASDGTYTYTLDTTLAAVQALDTGDTLTDAFNYTMEDGGGASSGSTVTITITGINDAPVFTSSNTPSTAENTTTVTTVAATDPENATVTFTLTGGAGADQGLFSITSGGALTFASAPNFEAPGDADTNNTYVVEVIASDGTLTSSQTITVTVTNVNEAPSNTVPGAQTFDEDNNRIFSAGNSNAISVSDPDGDVNVKVTLTATNGALTLSGVAGLNFTATCNGGTGDGTADPTMTFCGSVTNVNAALNGLTYDPTDHYNGSAAITILTDDQGNSGSGGALSSNGGVADSIALTINAVNDAPVIGTAGVIDRTATTIMPNMTYSVPGILGSVTDPDDGDPGFDPTFTLTAASCTGCTVTNLNGAAGTFDIEPPAGFTGTLQIDVTVQDDGRPGTASSNGKVNYNVAGEIIWFVDPASGLTTNSGTMSKPVQKIGDLTLRTANDSIFVYSGNHTGAVTLLSGEVLIGQGTTNTFDGAFGIIPPAGTAARPNTKANDPTRTNPVFDSSLTAASSTVVRNIAISSTGNGYIASGATNLTVSDSSVSAAGKAVDLTNSTASASGVTFTSTSSSAGTHGISLQGVNGAFSFGPGSLSNNSTAAFFLKDSQASTITYSGSLAPGGSGRAVLIGTADGLSGTNASNGMEAGTTVTLSGNITAGGVAVYESSGGTLNLTGTTQTWNTGTMRGVDLIDNNGATINFSSGNLNITTSSGTGFHASQGGTVNVTGFNNVINTTNGMALEVTGTAGEKIVGSQTWRTISADADGPANTTSSNYGVVVQHLTGGFTISGDGSTSLTTGGTISGAQRRGIELSNVSGAIALNNMTFTNAAKAQTVTGAGCGTGLNTANNTSCAAAVHLESTPGGVTLNRMSINGSVQGGINGYTVTNLNMSNIEVQNAGDEAGEHGILMKNLLGSGTASNLNVHDNEDTQLYFINVGNNDLSSYTISNSTFANTASPNGGQGVLVEAYDTGTTMNVAVSNGVFQNLFANAHEAHANTGSTMTASLTGSTITNANSWTVIQASDGGTMNYTISGNSGTTGALSGSNAINIKTDNADGAGATSTATGTITSNTIGSTAVGSGAVCGGGCNGIFVNQRHGGTLSVEIKGNTIRHVDQYGIWLAGGESYAGVDGKLVATVTGNLIQDPDGQTLSAIHVRSGVNSTDTSCVQAVIGNSTTAPGSWPTTTADAQNRIEGNWDPTPGSVGREIFVWERYTNTTLHIPGHTGTATDWLTNRNSITSTDGTNVSTSGTIGTGACP